MTEILNNVKLHFLIAQYRIQCVFLWAFEMGTPPPISPT